MESPGVRPDSREGEAPSGGDFSRVEAALRERYGSFGVFQLLRLLERMEVDRAPLAGFGDPAREVTRISHNPSLGFPAREVEKLDLDEEPVRLTSNVMGLVGAMGVLPHPYSMLALERSRDRDRTLVAFLDIFQHRVVSLLYAAWRKGIPELAVERGDPDRHREHLLALLGAAHEPREALGELTEDTLAWYTGLLSPATRSGPALEQLLTDRFQVSVEVEPFVGGWIPLRNLDLCRLGEEREADRLGMGAVVGDEVWDPHARIRIRMGPMDRETYDRLLPGTKEHQMLKKLVGFFTHEQFEAELQLVLARDEVPATVLGGVEGESTPPLGWGTWLKSRPRESDADETILTL